MRTTNKELTTKFAQELKEAFNKKFKQKIKSSQNNDFKKGLTNLYFIEFDDHKIYGHIYKNLKGDTVKLLFQQMIIDASINKYGVGDGKKPKIARTYVISYSLYANVKQYRRRAYNSCDTDEAKIYLYDRNKKQAIKRFLDWYEKHQLDTFINNIKNNANN